MGRKLDNWIVVYMLFSGLGDKHTSWATTVRNASQKDAEPPEFSTITAQLLDESWILAKSSAGTDTTIALIGKQFGKQKFSSTISSNLGPSTKRSSFCIETNPKKSGYNKATAKCTPCHRSYHAVEDCWFLHLEKARASWLARNQVESIKQPINLLTIGTLPVDLEESIPSPLFEPSPASPILFTMPDENELIPEEEKPMPTEAKDPTNISLDGFSELDMELLDIFSQEETSLIEDIAWNLNEVNKDVITLGLDQEKIPED